MHNSFYSLVFLIRVIDVITNNIITINFWIWMHTRKILKSMRGKVKYKLYIFFIAIYVILIRKFKNHTKFVSRCNFTLFHELMCMNELNKYWLYICEVFKYYRTTSFPLRFPVENCIISFTAKRKNEISWDVVVFVSFIVNKEWKFIMTNDMISIKLTNNFFFQLCANENIHALVKIIQFISDEVWICSTVFFRQKD